MGALTDAIEREVGVPTVPTFDPDTASVGVTVVRIAPADSNRLGLLIVNLSAGAVFVKPRRDVASTSGIRLAPNGGSLTLVWREDFHVVGLDWFAVAELAASSIMVLGVGAR